MPLVVLLLAATGCSSTDSGGAPSPSSDAALGALAVSAGTMTPAFASEVVTYAVTVSNSTATFQVTPTARSARAYAIQVKQGSGAFTTVASGSASPAYPTPTPGTTSSIMVRVIAEDQVHTTAYVVAVNRERALFTNADLASLGVSAGALSPTFVASTTSYTDTVPFGTTSITLTPAVAESHATVQVKQDAGAFVAVASGSPTAALTVPAYPGSTTVTVRVTAESGATNDYAVVVAQAAPSTDATLSALSVGGASLAPGFAPATNAYASTLSNGTSSFTVTATASEAHATLQIKQDTGAFTPVASGAASGGLTAPAPGGPTTTITVRVTAQSGDHQDYVITVDETAALSTDASLSALAIGGTTLSPSFATGTLTYSAILPYPTATFTVTPTTTEAHATVELQQDSGAYASTPNGSASAPLTAPAGDGVAATTIHLRVTPQDTPAAKQTITITVTRAAPSTNANLDALAISGTTLSPAFASASTGPYTAVLPYDASTFTVTPTVQESHATVEVQQGSGAFVQVASGSASPALTSPVNDGATTTTVTVRVTAQSGAQQDYTITVTRMWPPQEVTAFFPLYAGSLCQPTGDVSALQSFAPGPNVPAAPAGMVIKGYSDGMTAWAPATVWHDVAGAVIPPASMASTLMQRSQIYPDAGGVNTWPANEGDIYANRWVEFAVSTSPSKTLTVDAISMYAGSGGGVNLFYRVEYSTQPDFSGGVELTALSLPSTASLPAGVSYTKNDMYFRSTTGQSIVVPPGSTLHIRIFPWNQATATASGKYLLLQSFTVHGWVQ
jgi:hypothetical protein